MYLELPEFDLEDQNLLKQANVLFSPSNYIQEKFYNDAFLAIELIRVGINQWSFNGDLQTLSPLQEKEVAAFFKTLFMISWMIYLRLSRLSLVYLEKELWSRFRA